MTCFLLIKIIKIENIYYIDAHNTNKLYHCTIALLHYTKYVKTKTDCFKNKTKL